MKRGEGKHRFIRPKLPRVFLSLYYRFFSGTYPFDTRHFWGWRAGPVRCRGFNGDRLSFGGRTLLAWAEGRASSGPSISRRGRPTNFPK